MSQVKESPRRESDALIRPASAADIPALTAIYAHHVLHGTASFEIEPPDAAEVARRWQDITAKGFPWLVAEREGEPCGYAYAGPYRPRIAYRYTVEDSVYVHPERADRGLGGALLQAVIAACEAQGRRQMIAVIGDSANEASIRLHARLGFVPAGVLKNVGFKFGRWLDTVFMQRSLGPGAATPPADAHT